jgi:hypothetical protein
VSQYTVSGRGAGSNGETIACLWNPHASSAIRVFWCSFVYATAPAAFVNWALQRATARGTPALTIVPDADSHNGSRAGPPSGALLDLGDYTTDATRDASHLVRVPTPAVVGSGHDWWFVKQPIVVPAGTGLALAQVAAMTLTNVDVTFGWDEG